MTMESINDIIQRLGSPNEIIQKLRDNYQEVEPDSVVVEGCELCGYSGWLYPKRNGIIDYTRVIPCKCMKESLKLRRYEVLMQSCELPPAALNMTFENYKIYRGVEHAYEEAVDMANNPNRTTWMTITGTNGVGKTHLGVAICKAWIQHGIPARYALTSLLLDELREGFNSYRNDYENESEQKQNSYQRRFDYYCNIPLLMLDDYGIESNTKWVQEKLDTLVDYRLMHDLSLIVTSNIELDDMPSRIRSRLVRHHNHKLIAISVDDYALRK